MVLMAIKTYTEQLESVQAVIEEIETKGQAYSVEKSGLTATLTRANLAALYHREERLRVLAAREQNGGGIGVRYASPE